MSTAPRLASTRPASDSGTTTSCQRRLEFRAHGVLLRRDPARSPPARLRSRPVPRVSLSITSSLRSPARSQIELAHASPATPVSRRMTAFSIENSSTTTIERRLDPQRLVGLRPARLSRAAAVHPASARWRCSMRSARENSTDSVGSTLILAARIFTASAPPSKLKSTSVIALAMVPSSARTSPRGDSAA